MGTIDTVWKGYSDDERSVVADKGEIGFIDFEDDRSVCSYDPHAEGPVVVSVPFPFVKGKPQSILIGETAVDCITIQNTTSEPIELWKVCIYASNPEESFTLSVMEPPSATSDLEDIHGFLESFSLDDRVLQPRKTMKVWLSCKPKEIGIHTTAVHFDAGDDRIERVVFLLAEDNISQSIAPNKPYSREPRKSRHNVTEYVRGSRPAKETKHSFKYFLPNYPIPKDKREILERKEVPEELAMGLTRENYGAFFNILLIMEELELEEEMKNHDMVHVSMMRKRYFLALEVPGLAERRPSLVHGDFVFATPATENPDNTPSYQGYIHQVEADFVLLKFSDDLHRRHRDGDLYNIRFTYNRTNMRRLYQAVQAAHKLETKFLFPSQSFRRIEAPKVVPLVPCINEEQQRSVEMILGCKGGPPYVIHGPPGTGKTMTLVEAILQLYTTRHSARILVCASSNSAADHILEKLIGIEVATIRKQDIFRLNASSRPYEDVNPDHIHFCYFENYIFKCPPLRALNCYKIIISTYMSSSLLYAEGVKRGHFSHVFLDEAGQASEPETMIPISNLCCRETVVVLAGDPMQLGPIIYSRQAENYGLQKSYLERLFECEFYHNEDANFVIKLVKNYRCHQAILELPSKLFYKGELVACKKESDSCSDDWDDLLPNKDFPVLFVGIQGCDEREGNNPSWFNRIEVSKVIEIIQKLMRARDGLTEADIGVITPYRQQVLKLKKILEDKLDMPGIKVGSVEQFQGQERQVIIVSTVRSTIKHNEFDKIHYLGFLSNPRRFNVALTRAGSLLIIVGNPHIICKDPYWNKLLRYCADNDSYQGCPLPDVQEYPEEDLTGGYSVNCGGGWGDPQLTQAAEWGGELIEQQPNNEAGWGGEWTNAQPSQEAGWVDDWTDQQQSQEAGWGDPEPSNGAELRDEWGDPKSSNGAELCDEWSVPIPSNRAEWRDECGDPIPVNNAEWHDELGDPKPGNNAECRDEWGDPKPGNNTGWRGEWGDPKLENRAERHGGWDDSKPGNRAARRGRWGDPKPGNRAERHGGWTDPQPSNEAGWGDPTLSTERNWGDTSFSDLPKPVTDEAEWSDGWK